jgi:hypothetical protein
MPVTQAVAESLSVWQDGTPAMQAELEEQALNACETQDDWQACLEAFGERAVGNYIADNADEDAIHPFEPEGCAYVTIGTDQAALVEWNNQGFYDVTLTSLEEASKAVGEANAEYAEGDEDEQEEEEETPEEP